jgi:hypothetical protein
MVVALVVVVSACTSSTGDTTTTVPVTLTTSSSTTSSTTTTTVPATTTTTVPVTTTTTTTTVPQPDFGFFVDGLGVVDFGATPEEVAAALEPFFGEPTTDSGWFAEILCPGDNHRFFQFGEALFDFRVLFTDGDLFRDDGVGHFYTFAYKGQTEVPVTPPDLTVGTTVAQFEDLYPEVEYSPNPFLQNVTDYRVDGDTEYELLYGQVSGTDPDDVVETVQGGIGCGE